MKTLLVTGFDKWQDVPYNSSWETLQRCRFDVPADWHVEKTCLPVSWQRAPVELFRRLNANIVGVICFGMGTGATVVCEQQAHNFVNPFYPDVDRRYHATGRVLLGALPTYAATLPQQAIVNALRAKHIPAALSKDAGAYLCNYVFYRLMHHIYASHQHLACGFIHLPPFPSEGGLAPATLANSAELAVRTTIEHIENSQNR